MKNHWNKDIILAFGQLKKNPVNPYIHLRSNLASLFKK